MKKNGKNYVPGVGPVEVLTFMKGDALATVVTDGHRYHSYENRNGRRIHKSLGAAIAHLEYRGYEIVIS